MFVTPLDADQFFSSLFSFGGFFPLLMPAEEEADQAVTRKDLTDFRSFLLDQLKVHTSELSSKFDKATNDAESALLVTKQHKAESELKFTHLGNVFST